MPEVHRYKVVKMLSEDGSRISYDPHGPDVVRADDFDRVTAERDALQADLSARDQRVDELEAALRFYADREHYHFESGNWDTVSGEPLNILWCGDEPDFIEDGTVARSALERIAHQPAPVADADWRMNPCKQGHRDVGAAGGVASCYQCGEKITAATTEEAFALWNAGHPKACCGSCPAGCIVGAKP